VDISICVNTLKSISLVYVDISMYVNTSKSILLVTNLAKKKLADVSVVFATHQSSFFDAYDIGNRRSTCRIVMVVRCVWGGYDE